MFNKPTSEASMLSKSLHLPPVLGVTKFVIYIDLTLATLVVILKSDLDVQQAHLCGLYYKCLTIVIYNHNDIGLYYKPRDDRN